MPGQLTNAEIFDGSRTRPAKRHKQLGSNKHRDVVRYEAEKDGSTVGINAGGQPGDVK